MADEKKEKATPAEPKKEDKPEVKPTRLSFQALIEDFTKNVPDWLKPIAYPVLLVCAAVLAVWATVLAVFQSETSGSIANTAREIVGLIGDGLFRGWTEVKTRLPHLRKRIGKIVFILGGLELSLLLIAISCLWFGANKLFVGWLAIVAVVIPYLMAYAIQVVVCRMYGSLGNLQHRANAWKLGIDIARPFAAMATITLFVAVMAVVLPDSFRTGRIATIFALMLMLGSSYLLLRGRTSNRAYQLMYVAGIVIPVCIMIWETAMPGGLRDFVKTAYDTSDQEFGFWSDQLSQHHLRECIVTDTAKLISDAGAIYSKPQLTKGMKVVMDRQDHKDFPALTPYKCYLVNLVAAGETYARGYVPSVVLQDVVPEVKTETTAQAKPKAEMAAKPEPPKEEAKAEPVKPEPVKTKIEPAASTGVDVTEVLAGTDWVSTGMIVRVGDLVEWGPFKTTNSLKRLEFRLGSSLETNSPGINGDPGNYVGLSTAWSNATDAELRIRIKAGEPLMVPLALKRGAYKGQRG